MKWAIFCAIPLVALAACGGAEENKTNGKAEALQPGQYEVTAEVTNFRAADKGTPKINTKQGDSTTRSVCLAEGPTPNPDLFADEGFTCRHAGSSYARSGTLNLTLQCTGEGQRGEAGYNINGRFTGDTFEAQRTLETLFVTDGDVVIATNIRGRRTGDCVAAPAAPTEKTK